ncbi:MAG: hypothetical protein QFX32_05665 [Methanolinea sp.]|nr:hypothetical protein [Methanolinea sp.]
MNPNGQRIVLAAVVALLVAAPIATVAFSKFQGKGITLEFKVPQLAVPGDPSRIVVTGPFSLPGPRMDLSLLSGAQNVDYGPPPSPTPVLSPHMGSSVTYENLFQPNTCPGGCCNCYCSSCR